MREFWKWNWPLVLVGLYVGLVVAMQVTKPPPWNPPTAQAEQSPEVAAQIAREQRALNQLETRQRLRPPAPRPEPAKPDPRQYFIAGAILGLF